MLFGSFRYFNNLSSPLYTYKPRLNDSSIKAGSHECPTKRKKEKRIERRSTDIKFCLGLLADFHDVSPIFFLFQSRGSWASFSFFIPVLNHDSQDIPNIQNASLVSVLKQIFADRILCLYFSFQLIGDSELQSDWAPENSTEKLSINK